MTYGFKFLNDNNEIVVDDISVTPWFYGQAEGGSISLANSPSDNYFPESFNELSKKDAEGNWSTIFNPVSGINYWTVYKITYPTPPSYNCFVMFNLPVNASNVYYSCDNPVSLQGSSVVTLYAYAPNEAWTVSVADVPKGYVFVADPIPTAQKSTGYGLQVFNPSAQCMFDSGKRHFQPKGFPLVFVSGLYNEFITNPQNYSVPSGYTGFSTISGSVPANSAWLLPSVDIVYGRWDDNEQVYKSTHSVAMYKRSYSPGSTNGLIRAQPKTNTVNSSTYSNQTGLFNNSYIITTGQQQGLSTGGAVLPAVVVDATALDQGYTAPELPQTFTLTRDKSGITEGYPSDPNTKIVITLTTTAVPNGTLVPWTITGTNVNADDFFGTTSGSFNVSYNSSTVTVYAIADSLAEGTETATLALTNGKSSISFTISDAVSYSLSSFMTPEEGQSIAVTLTTAGLPNGSTVPYTVTGITAADLTVGSLTGNFTISNNTGALEFRFAKDSGYDPETMRISVNNGATYLDIPITNVPYANEILTIAPSNFTTTEYTTIAITGGFPNTSFEFLILPTGTDPVYAWNNRWLPEYQTSIIGTQYFDENGNYYNNTSNGLDFGGNGNWTLWIFTTYSKNFRSANVTVSTAPTFSITGTDGTKGPLTVNEGTTGYFKVTTTNIPNGTLVYPKFRYTDFSASDYTNTAASGVAVQNNVATFQITFAADALTEGVQESGELIVEYPSGTYRDSYGYIYVNDTSLNPPSYSLTRTTGASQNEGTASYFYLTTNQATNLYWTLNGTNITANDIVAAGAYDSEGNYYSYGADLSGIINQTYYQLFIYFKNDVTTEGNESLTVNIRTGSTTGTIVASSSVTIVDTSTTPTYNESVTIVSDAGGDYIVELSGYMTITVGPGAPNTGFTFAITNNGDPQPTSFPSSNTLDSSGYFYNYITGATAQGGQTVGDKRLWVKFNYDNNVRSARFKVVYDAGTLSGGEYCSGFTRYQNYNDGRGGTYAQVVATNSPACGYVQQYTPTRSRASYKYYNFDFMGDTWRINGGRPGGPVTATIVTGPYAGFALSGTFNSSGVYSQVIGDYGVLAVGTYTLNFTFPGDDAYYSTSYRTIVASFLVIDDSAGGGIIP